MIEDVPDPTAEADTVIVELKAIGVNHRDLLVRRPPTPEYVFPLPFVPGLDGAGIRRDTGEEVVIYPVIGWGRDAEVPDEKWRLLGGRDDGTYAQLIAVSSNNLFPKPANLSWEESATLAVAGVTAYRALFQVAKLAQGETLVVLGAGGGVSTTAVALGAQVGARVLVTSSSQHKIDLACKAGAEGGVLYTASNWPDQLKRLNDGRAADVVLDSIGSTWEQSLQALSRGGRLVVIGATAGNTTNVDVRSVYLNWRSILGSTLGSPTDFEHFLAMVSAGSWRPAIDSVSRLDEVERVHARLKKREQFGKLVLLP